jgi:drug/metabolite transporter (DMT)-like permease
MITENRPQTAVRRKGIVFASATVALWSTLPTALKLCTDRTDAFTAAVLVGFFATLSLLLWLVIRGKTRMIWAQFQLYPVYFIVTGMIGLGIQQILYLRSYAYLPASQVVVLFYLYPLLMVLLSSLFFREKVAWQSVVCIGTGFAGVYVLVSRGTFLTIDLSAGVYTTLGASLAWALFSVLLNKRPFDIEIGMFLFNLFGLVFLTALIPVFGLNTTLYQAELARILYIAVFPTALAFVTWNRALTLVPVSMCSGIALATPLLATLVIVAVLREELHPSFAAGMILIVGSVLINLRYSK